MLLKKRRKYETCDCCKNPIYYENEEYEQDPCYQLDDETILCDFAIRKGKIGWS